MSYGKMLAALAAIAVLGQVPGASAQQPIAIATPPAGSIYNSTASAIGKVLAEKAGLHLTVQALGGSSQYLPIINAGEAPFGIANVFETAQGVNGEAYFKGRPTKDIRTVAILYPLRNTIFVKKDSKYKKLADLKGARGPIGFTNQKTLTAVTNAALAPGGISLKDMKGVQRLQHHRERQRIQGRPHRLLRVRARRRPGPGGRRHGRRRARAIRAEEDAGDRSRGEEAGAGRLSAL